jgi:hypothetical protein
VGGFSRSARRYLRAVTNHMIFSSAAHKKAHLGMASLSSTKDEEHCVTKCAELVRLTSFDVFYVPDDYDYSMPTCVNYSTNSQEMFGPYAHIRQNLDLSYHGNYNQKRQKLQDMFIRDTVSGATAYPEGPWVIFTAGAMGAGKGHVIKWMSKHGHFALPDIVQIDPDVFRSRFPEWNGCETRPHHDVTTRIPLVGLFR